MAGTTWPSLVVGSKAKASEVEAKFEWSEQHIVPHNAGTKTDATYDVGETSFRFRNGYFSGRLVVGAGATNSLSLAFGTGGVTSGIYFPSPSIATMGVVLTQVERYRFAENLMSVGFNSSGEKILEIKSSNEKVGIDFSPNGARRARIYVNNSETALRLNTDGISPAQTRLLITQDGIIQKPKQSSFLAFLTSIQNDVTGDGTNATVPFNNEVYDLQGDFLSNVFTAPIAGKYLFTVSVNLRSLDTASVESVTLFLTTPNVSYRNVVITTSAIYVDLQLNINVIADMDALDTISVSVGASGGSKTVDIIGAVSPAIRTYFSGSLLN